MLLLFSAINRRFRKKGEDGRINTCWQGEVTDGKYHQAWQGTNIVAIFTEEGPLCPVTPETQGATNHDSLLQERVSCAHNSGSPLLIGKGPAVSGDTSKMGNQETWPLIYQIG